MHRILHFPRMTLYPIHGDNMPRIPIKKRIVCKYCFHCKAIESAVSYVRYLEERICHLERELENKNESGMENE